MISSEFAEKLAHFDHLKKHFYGVFSADTLPKVIRLKSFIICNTDISSGPGKHWYCIVKLQPGILECFDSLGVDSDKKKFLYSEFCHKNIKKLKFNVTRVQSLESDTCGYFVLYFIVHRFFNQDLNFTELVNEIFVKSSEENELKVKEFSRNWHNE